MWTYVNAMVLIISKVALDTYENMYVIMYRKDGGITPLHIIYVHMLIMSCL